MKSVGALLITSVFCFCLFGCSKESSKPTCENAADHVSKILKKAAEKAISDLPLEEQADYRRETEKELSRDKIVEKCKQDKPSKEALECVLGAKDAEGIKKCTKDHDQKKKDKE